MRVAVAVAGGEGIVGGVVRVGEEVMDGVVGREGVAWVACMRGAVDSGEAGGNGAVVWG